MDLINCIITEKETFEIFSLDRIMDAIVKVHGEVNASIGVAASFLGKITMTQYTCDRLGCKTQIKDGQKAGMLDVKEFDGNQMQDFVEFRRRVSKYISWEQSAALYWSQKIPDCYLVSESEQVLDCARGLGVTVMTIEEMQEAFFADEVIETAGSSQSSTCVAGPFDPRVDEDKVLAAFSDGLDGDLAVLRNKSYWTVVCVLFERFEWLKLRKRDVFCRWVNAHFKFDKPLNHMIDMKSAINKIKVKEYDLKLWPPNQYRDLAFRIIELFFGKRVGQPNGFYVYANESQFLKPGKTWRRKDW